MNKAISCAAAGLVLGLTLGTAEAELKFDLRAFAIDAGLGSISSDGKLVTLNGSAPGSVNLQVWAQVTNTAPINNVFGIWAAVGSVVSTPGAGGAGLTGRLSPSIAQAPYTGIGFGGTVQELSAVPDGILDLGTNLSNSVNGSIYYSYPPQAPGFGAGTPVGRNNIYVPSNLDPVGATFGPIADGYEFLLGTILFNAETYSGDGSFAFNWVLFPDTATMKPLRAAAGYWTDGGTDAAGTLETAVTNRSEMSVGVPVSFQVEGPASVVPEPGSSALFLGGLALLGARRRR